MSLSDVDKPYRRIFEKTPEVVERVYREAKSLGKVPLDELEITKAILLRMGSFYRSQNKVKGFIVKNVAGASGAYFFADTICFYLKLFIETYGLLEKVKIESETKIIKKDENEPGIRPDVSIWSLNKENVLLATIECKTQLGYDRHNWRSNFNNRKKRIQSIYPESKHFLLVLSTTNWDGFNKDDPVGSEYFVILNNKWPDEFKTRRSIKRNTIENSIEDLFKLIEEICV